MVGTHISLFAGVGMTDIAVQAFGFETIATAEIDPFCQSVLRQRFPTAWHFDDVRHIGLSSPHWPQPGDIIQRPLFMSGGFPCQDVSSSGTGTGLSGERSGLWSEFDRIIGDLQPEFILIENSPLLRKRGMGTVLCDLASHGYDARWDCIPAASVGAPHLRDRIFIVAWKVGIPWINARLRLRGEFPRAGTMINATVTEDMPRVTTADARVACLMRHGVIYPTPTRADGSGGPGTSPKRTGGKNLRTVVSELEGNGRLSPMWVDWMMGLPVGWTNPDIPNSDLVAHAWSNEPPNKTVGPQYKNRSKRIRALGNGLVPHAAAMAISTLMPQGQS